MTRLPFTVDGVDFSARINRFAYSVGYEKREGSLGGMMLDGTETVDVRAYKAVDTVSTNGMRSEELAQLLTALLKPYVQLQFFDTRINDTRTATFIPYVSPAPLGFVASDRKVFDTFQITLRER